MRKTPVLEIEYCTGCRWQLRAAWLAQELLTTFEADLGSRRAGAGLGRRAGGPARRGADLLPGRAPGGSPRPGSSSRPSATGSRRGGASATATPPWIPRPDSWHADRRPHGGRHGTDPPTPPIRPPRRSRRPSSVTVRLRGRPAGRARRDGSARVDELRPYLDATPDGSRRLRRQEHATHGRPDRTLRDGPRAGPASRSRSRPRAMLLHHAQTIQLHLTQVIAIGRGRDRTSRSTAISGRSTSFPFQRAWTSSATRSGP